VNRYLVILLRTPAFDAGLIAAHAAFLDDLRAAERLELAGPFADQSGGAYLMRAESLDQARELAFGDPLHAAGASAVTVYEWQAK
jgi:uncharacterized protein YciI